MPAPTLSGAGRGGPGCPGSSDPEQLTTLRALLGAADFNAPEVCRRVGIDSIYDFRAIREGRTVGVETEDRLDLLIRLFLDVELVDRGLAESLLSQGEVRLL